jgi:hypothetical protein
MGNSEDRWLVDVGDQDPLDWFDHAAARRELRAEQRIEAGCSLRELHPRQRAWRRRKPRCQQWWRPDPND